MLYRTDDATRWGVGKGANLTPIEIDRNFWELAERLVAVEGGGASPNSISNITVVGSQMTVYLDDGTALGPYTLPTAMIRYRGDWVAGAAYVELDLVAVPNSGVYLVLRDHASAATFDANAQDAEGNQLYRWLFPMGAAQTLGALTDVDVATTAPVDRDVLSYNAEAGLWMPRAPSGGGSAGALNDLSDVEFTAPAVADFLRFDGTAWVDAPVAWADIPDKPATFPPSAHTHSWADVTGRPATIDAIPATVGTDGQVLKASAGEIVWAADETAGGAMPTVSDKTGSYTFALADGGNFVDYSAAGAGSFTIPNDATVNFPVGTVIAGGQIGAGALTIQAAGGVALNGVTGGGATLTDSSSEYSVRKRAANSWRIAGDHGGVA